MLPYVWRVVVSVSHERYAHAREDDKERAGVPVEEVEEAAQSAAVRMAAEDRVEIDDDRPRMAWALARSKPMILCCMVRG